MNKRPPLPMTPLDMLVTTQELQIIKSILPYFPPSFRNILAIYLKFNEFQTALRLFHNSDPAFTENLIKSKSLHSPFDILAELKEYISPEDAATFDNILNAFQMMNAFQGENPASDHMDADQSSHYSDMLNQFDSILKGMERKHERMDGSSGNEKH